jgi:hypothetical protein
MALNTVTLVLNGDVSLEAFAEAIVHFNELVKALSEEVGSPDLDWRMADLQVSSAMATSQGFGLLHAIEAVVHGFDDVGAALETNKPINHAEPVKVAAQKIVSIRDRRIPSVRFETAIREWTAPVIPIREDEAAPPLVMAPDREPELPSETVEKPTPRLTVSKVAPAFGGVHGRIQTLTNRAGLRFTLFDVLHDKAVSCYLAEGEEDKIRDLWGRMAVVEGMVTRDPESGRPIAVRQIRDITPMPEPCQPYEWQAARGAAPSLTGLSAEEAIRRIRDAQ